MTKTQRIAQLEEEIGSLSSPSKMPSNSYSISARDCKVGGKLVELANSICEGCYALKGHYNYPTVKTAHSIRKEAMLHNPNWVSLISELIKLKEKSGYFRWFDSGDLQSLENLRNIALVAENLPEIKFWLPTKEWGIVSEYKKKYGEFPENLTVRLSAYFLDKEVSEETKKKLNCVSSSVTTDKNKVTCPSSKQGNKCLDCRACWNKNVENVSYGKH